MTDVNSGANKYAGNSNRDKAADEVPEKKVEQVTKAAAVQRKKPLGRRIAENFTGADAHSVGQYVIFEVVVPRVKELIFDVGESALRRSLFGESPKGYSSRSIIPKGYTAYNAIASGAISKVQQQVSRQAPQPGSDEFGEIIVESRGEAQEVMDKIGNLIETYGMASVSDLKAAVGLTGNFTDEKFGWVAMGGTDIRRTGGATPGYVLIFPRPEELP